MVNDVSIIIVSYNTKELTKNCLLSVYEKTTDINFDVFVVDNNSSDDSVEMIEQEFPQVKLIKNKDNRGFGAANNIAIQQSDAKYVFLLNSDTLLINNAIKILYDYMEQNPDVGACGGNLYYQNMMPSNIGCKFPSVTAVLFKYGLRNIFKKFYHEKVLGDSINRESICEIDLITGADLMMRKSVLDKVGLFDENFFMYFEESDLEYRIQKNGHKVMFVPNSKIIHLEGASLNSNYKKKVIFKKSELYYFRKNKGFLDLIAIKILYFGLYIIDFLLTRNFDSLRMIKVVLKG